MNVRMYETSTPLETCEYVVVLARSPAIGHQLRNSRGRDTVPEKTRETLVLLPHPVYSFGSRYEELQH